MTFEPADLLAYTVLGLASACAWLLVHDWAALGAFGGVSFVAGGTFSLWFLRRALRRP